MRISLWRRGSLRVTSSNDRFYNRPLPDMTLFWLDVGRADVEPHTGAFSIKAVFSGRECYNFGRRRAWVHPGQTLLVNAGETYGSVIDRPSTSLSVFYRTGDVASAARAIAAHCEDLLDNPHDEGAPPELAQIVLTADGRTRRHLNELAAAAGETHFAAAEDAARNLLAAALRRSLSLVPPLALSHIVKRSTRNELLTRVMRARTAIHDRQGEGCTLDGLAQLACLSKYHFLRVFSEAFGETPLAMARRLRLEAAKRALDRGEHVTAVARLAGFGDLRAFNRAFHRAFGAAGSGPLAGKIRNFEHRD